ncbi:MAG: hypothetical protein ACHP7N_05115 [Caulobacterales bacterium]
MALAQKPDQTQENQDDGWRETSEKVWRETGDYVERVSGLLSGTYNSTCVPPDVAGPLLAQGQDLEDRLISVEKNINSVAYGIRAFMGSGDFAKIRAGQVKAFDGRGERLVGVMASLKAKTCPPSGVISQHSLNGIGVTTSTKAP